MRRVEVLIVGGGPAGSTLARSLGQGGLEVALMDRALFPRDKVCAGWITPAVVQELELNPSDYADGRILQPITGFRIGMLGDTVVDTDHGGEVVSYGIRRREFDHYLLQRAEEAGAVLWQQEGFRDARPEGEGWLVNGEIHCRLLIGAGGHFCPVARLLARNAGERDGAVVAAQEIEFALSPEQAAGCAVDPLRPELYFSPDLAGYGWVFRKGDWLNIGLGREDRHGLSGHLRDLVRTLQSRGRIPDQIPDRFHGHAYLLYPHARRPLTGRRALLIGDAAGLAYPQSGEGIRPAVESALLAAETIVAAAGDYGETALAPYGERMVERFGRRRPGPGWLERLPAGIKRSLARRLMHQPWFARRIIAERWFLHRQQAPLAAVLPGKPPVGREGDGDPA
ncbi:MAG TPA: NAD(P)/FAD-dependent oxidoreductase [Sedimenticola thiotaurini]|uniref:Protein CbrA n=1 Tax=Sedimenticola thiotaurini TaxID=1543721 RepID=A0A831W2L0_9GAMM|nr:NAD(P)/FAD-dependent oxidoreductase [Sedimenticola thiotaurini]